MKNKTTNKNAMIMIVIGAILLIAGCYQVFNPVLAVSAPDDRTDMQMLATTTFEVTGADPTVETTWTDGAITSINEGEPVEVTCTWDYGGTTEYGSVHLVHCGPSIETTFHSDGYAATHTGSRTLSAVVPLVDANEPGAYFVCILTDPTNTQIAASHGPTYTILDVPIPPAQIDDATDTLTLDKDSYSSGDVVTMTATGTNIGGKNWHGSIIFYTTDPEGITGEAYEYELDVAAGATESRDGTTTLPDSAKIGTWTIQSKWIDDNGNVHALSTIDLGTETIWGMDTKVLGGLIVMIGIMLLIFGIMARKE